MIQAFVGSGGKTTLLHSTADAYRAQGKSVFVTTTTHMFIEQDTLLTDDPDVILKQLEETGYVMAGIPEGNKINALSDETYHAVCAKADVVLVEADGSKQLPLKFPNSTEPVIPDNTDEIVVVCGLNAIGQKLSDVCHRPELVKSCLCANDDTVITPSHIKMLLTEGYLKPLAVKYPNIKLTVFPRHDGSLYQKVIACVLKNQGDVSLIQKEWFQPQPRLIICGGGHVARELCAMASYLDFSIKVIDDRADLVTKDHFPAAESLVCDAYDNLSKYLEKDACYVIVTPHHKGDYKCVSAILPTDYLYLGMIGSKGKVAAAFDKLRADGFTEQQINSIYAPIGLSIGAVTPAEIAVSILAQIIQVKSKHHVGSADRSLLEVSESGILAVIIEKHGSAPRGVGSMMFIGENRVLGSIGGGASENQAINDALSQPEYAVRKYVLNTSDAKNLDMVCGGEITVMFIPV